MRSRAFPLMWVGLSISCDKFRSKIKSQKDTERWEEVRVDQSMSGMLKSPSRTMSLQCDDTSSDMQVIKLAM